MTATTCGSFNWRGTVILLARDFSDFGFWNLDFGLLQRFRTSFAIAKSLQIGETPVLQLLLAALLALVSHASFAAEKTAAPAILIQFAPTAAVPVASDRTVLVRMTRQPPIIDGNLDDACWQEATATSGFYNADNGQDARQKTQALLCHSPDALHIAVTCDQAAPKEFVELFFDSMHDEATYYSIRICSDGSHSETSYGLAPVPRNSGLNFACSQQGERWIVELSLPKAALRDPQNGLWGFNIVRQSGDPHPVTTTWNRVIGDPSRPEVFGHLAFEAKPCYVKAVRLDFPHRGTNTLNVAIVNASPVNLDLNAAIIVRRRDGKQTQPPNKFALNTGEGRWFAFDFPLDSATSDIAFDLFDPKDKTWFVRVTRRGVAVKPLIELKREPQVGMTGLIFIDYTLNVPADLLPNASMSVTLRAKTGRATTAFAQTGKVPSAQAEITVDATSLAPGTYIVRTTVAAPPLGTDSAETSITVPPVPTH